MDIPSSINERIRLGNYEKKLIEDILNFFAMRSANLPDDAQSFGLQDDPKGFFRGLKIKKEALHDFLKFNKTPMSDDELSIVLSQIEREGTFRIGVERYNKIDYILFAPGIHDRILN